MSHNLIELIAPLDVHFKLQVMEFNCAGNPFQLMEVFEVAKQCELYSLMERIGKTLNAKYELSSTEQARKRQRNTECNNFLTAICELIELFEKFPAAIATDIIQATEMPITQDLLENMYVTANQLYKLMRYDACSKLMFIYLTLSKLDDSNYGRALLTKFKCNVLTEDWRAVKYAWDQLVAYNHAMPDSKDSHYNRSLMMLYGLFWIFEDPVGLKTANDMFLLGGVRMDAHYIRYLCAAYIMGNKSTCFKKQIMELIEDSEIKVPSSDAIIDLFAYINGAYYVDVDQAMQEVEELILTDCILCHTLDLFMGSVQVEIAKTKIIFQEM